MRKPKTAKAVQNLIVVSDLHCGCRLGLCPPEGTKLDDGGTYIPSKAQQKVWVWWTEFWEQWVPMVTRGEPYAVVLNGDVVDGVHHGSTTQISHNLGDQERLAVRILSSVANECGGRLYFIRGTEVHVGQSGVDEERIAQRVHAIPNEDGQSARYDLWIQIGDCLVHLMHHIGFTSSSAHESSAVNAELTAEYVEAARWGKRPPDFVVRSHRHRSIAVDLNGSRGYAAAIVTPGWQLKTPFSWKIAGARISVPQFGGIAIRQGDEEFYYRRWVKTIERTAVEVPS